MFWFFLLLIIFSFFMGFVFGYTQGDPEKLWRAYKQRRPVDKV